MANLTSKTITRRALAGPAAGILLLACGKAPEAEKAQPEKAATPAPEMQVDYSFLVDAASQPIRVSEEHPFKSGDRFRLEIRPVSSTYVYLLNRGASDREYSFLFPNKRILQSNPLPGAQIVTLPEREWYTLDKLPGIENVVLIASAEPLQQFSSTDGPIPQEECEKRIALLELERRPSTFRRTTDRDWTHLFAAKDQRSVLVARLPIDHRAGRAGIK